MNFYESVKSNLNESIEQKYNKSNPDYNHFLKDVKQYTGSYDYMFGGNIGTDYNGFPIKVQYFCYNRPFVGGGYNIVTNVITPMDTMIGDYLQENIDNAFEKNSKNCPTNKEVKEKILNAISALNESDVFDYHKYAVTVKVDDKENTFEMTTPQSKKEIEKEINNKGYKVIKIDDLGTPYLGNPDDKHELSRAANKVMAALSKNKMKESQTQEIEEVVNEFKEKNPNISKYLDEYLKEINKNEPKPAYDKEKDQMSPEWENWYQTTANVLYNEEAWNKFTKWVSEKYGDNLNESNEQDKLRAEKAYMKYVNDWMEDREFSPEDELRYWSGKDDNFDLSDYDMMYQGLYDENGIGGELFVSYDEFLNNEYQMNESDDNAGVYYTVYTTSEVAPGEYKTNIYDTYDSQDQAAETVSYLHSQGINATYTTDDKKPEGLEETDETITQDDVDWLQSQGHKEKLDKLVGNFKATGDVEKDTINLTNLASNYFYDQANIYNKEIDNLCSRWAQAKAVELNNINETDEQKPITNVGGLEDGKNYWVYVSKHGLGPGTIPNDVEATCVCDLPNTAKTIFCVDRELTPEEMSKYELSLFDNDYFNRYPEVIKELFKM